MRVFNQNCTVKKYMAAKPIEVLDVESSHSSLISDTLIETLQGKGNINHNQLLATVKASRLDDNQSLQKEDIQHNSNDKFDVHILKNIEEESNTNKVGFESPQQTGQDSGVSKQDTSKGRNGQEEQHQEQPDTEIPQEPDKVRRHSNILKREGSKANQDTSGNFFEQSEKHQNQIDSISKQEADVRNFDDIGAMDKSQSRSSYSHFNPDNELPTKEDSRQSSNAINESLDEASSLRHFSDDFDKFVGEVGDGYKRNSSRSSRNTPPRSFMENVIDDERCDNSGYSNQEHQTQCDQDCGGRCRNQTIQTCPASILKRNPYSSERSFDFNQVNHGGHRDMQCPFMRVVSDQTTNAPTSGYSIYNIPCDCQQLIMTSNKKLQTSEENLSGDNVRYYCTNSTRPNSNQTVALQDSRGDTNISESREPSLHPECRCCPETRKKSAPEFQSPQVALTEYEQLPSKCPERKYDRSETYMNTAESPDYYQPCPGYNSKRRTRRSITCNLSLTPRSNRFSTRYSPSDVEDFDQFVALPSPRGRCLPPVPCDRQPVQRTMSQLEPPPWCSPDCRKPKSKPKIRCMCNCCWRGDPTPPPPPLPEFFCCPDEEEDEVSEQTPNFSDDDSFCEDPGSPMGLSYQDNEEYQALLMELEEALACRNRNRVRRAIQEFEHRSRLNKPLERPIIDYNETSRSEEPLIDKLSQLWNSRKAGRHRERPVWERRSQSREEKEYPHEEYSRPNLSRRQLQTGPKRERSRLSKWKMNEAGEWYKSPRALKRSSRSSSPRKEYNNDICTCCTCKVYNRGK